MQVYRFSWDRDHFGSLTSAQQSDPGAVLDLAGQRAAASWPELSVHRIVESDVEAELPLGDFPFLSANLPVLSKRAVTWLRPLIAPAVEFLPLRCPLPLGEYYATNVILVIDALDEQRSRIDYFKATGRVKEVRRYRFRPTVVQDLAVFRIPQTARSEVLVTDAFVRAVRDGGLAGFSENLVGSLPMGAVPYQ